jgi:hypothetical protein
MHRAALANERSAVQVQHPIHLDENAPEHLRPCAVVRVVYGVALEGDRRRRFDRHRPDVHTQPGAAAHLDDGAVEIGDRHCLEWHRRGPRIGRLQIQAFVDEVELERE